ncbi:hypothetical protein [Bradyrhizobium sp. CCBAU 11434]|uniref:hypothetical protein n=1 Tax=Bradyrhizobium sp. CCBAU 11434 TaxID=1630885 RepID=UPI0023067580|nr:hypothetical protein [Bradyrhizobium sp. CCBAU 11434]
MRSILALSLLIALCGVANAAPVHHPHRHPVRASSYAYVPPRETLRDRPGTADCNKPEPYFGACQGYAPGEKERFLQSVFSP